MHLSRQSDAGLFISYSPTFVKKGEVIKALGHDYKNGKCTRCGAVRDSVKTGDEANITLWIAVLTMSAAAAAFVVAVLMRKKSMN